MEKLPRVVLFLALAGMAVSLYLVYYHYQVKAGSKGWCDISEEVSCDKVLLSDYAEIAGMPLGVFGFVWFAVVTLLYYSKKIKSLSKLLGDNTPFYLFVWSLVGLSSVVWLVYVEIFLLGAICIICTVAHVLGVAILVVAYLSLKKPIINYLKDIFYE